MLSSIILPDHFDLTNQFNQGSRGTSTCGGTRDQFVPHHFEAGPGQDRIQRRDHGAKALSGALKNNSALADLDLSGNHIKEPGAHALAELLTIRSALSTLKLKHNRIGDDGTHSLAEALNTNSTFVNFNLSNNSTGCNGAIALAEALRTNSTLKTPHYTSILSETKEVCRWQRCSRPIIL
ncbi:hypothetical protein EMPS_00199 [Entomortierella parvispora]|uniref:Uncharacterized protein n=1 Tax=Entomortierella parvispora TaxID=205924 RepID=A0A9P3LR50_9FUNG|nr:hypothetical protein EMPS_00199 [Entomortierella parvispora]